MFLSKTSSLIKMSLPQLGHISAEIHLLIWAFLPAWPRGQRAQFFLNMSFILDASVRGLSLCVFSQSLLQQSLSHIWKYQPTSAFILVFKVIYKISICRVDLNSPEYRSYLSMVVKYVQIWKRNSSAKKWKKKTKGGTRKIKGVSPDAEYPPKRWICK